MSDGTNLPLAGMRVLDLTRALSGPFCTAILGDLGADVMKVESAATGDMSRTWGPFVGEESTFYLSANRNKRSMALDFRSPQAPEILKRMALSSDVVVENFKPDTLKKMGLDPDLLRLEKPGLIIASISGYGSSGPLSSRPGFDQIAQGHAGFMSVTGAEETGPARVGVPIGDMTAGMWLAIGILSAWISRQRGGPGQFVETSLLSSLVGLLGVQGQRYLSLGQVATRTGNAHPVIAPYGTFHTADGLMNICVATQDMWQKFCGIINRPEIELDSRFCRNHDRVAHREELRELIEAELVRHNRQEWTEMFLDIGIPAGPINTVSDALEDLQVGHLGLVETHSHPTLGELRQLSNPLNLETNSTGWIRRSPPLLGQHSRELLAELGFSRDDIAGFEINDVVRATSVTTGSDQVVKAK